ncbi:MAG TPA: hypothetical protein VJJ82_04040 [Candidatus Nanoarchaeia archaeon]|nr:hypothetical protein [Candidatus Nanoarchaeia archaeon]
MPQLERIEIGAFEFSVVDRTEFRLYEREWGDSKHINKADTCFRLRNTVMDMSHRDLLGRLRDCTNVFKVGVRKGGKRKWDRCRRDELTAERIGEFARYARDDHLKRNYLEAYFGGESRIPCWATLEFGVKDEMIVGYKLTIPPPAVPLFNMPQTILGYSHAIWVPERPVLK